MSVSSGSSLPRSSAARVPVPRVARDQLAGSVDGQVLLPNDEEYEIACALFNATVTHRPAVIVRAAGRADVAACLRFARDRGLEVSVRGGGHGVAGHATAGDLVIDLSGLRAVGVDPANRLLTAGGGATWGEVDDAAQEHGLATPGGRVSSTGIGGLTLGGGQGWLSPLHGLSADNLLSAEVVLADGRVVTASADSEPDLFWALRGGGGAFGVVTAFTYRLHEVGPMIYGGIVVHPLDRAPDVAALYEDFVATAPREVSGALVFAFAPEAPFVPRDLVGAPVVIVVMSWFGSDAGEGERVLAPLRTFGPPMVDLVQHMPYTGLQCMVDEMNLPGFRNYWSATYARGLDGIIGPVLDAMPNAGSTMSSVVLAPMGAAVNEVPEDATAFAHRDAGWLVHPLAMYTDPAADASQRGWVRALMDQVRPHTMPGAYLNLVSEPETDEVRDAYAGGYRRLAEVKDAYDPDQVFRHAAGTFANR
ncbi:MAG: FAD-binding oxidoreductase [Actinomycetes bacterium]